MPASQPRRRSDAGRGRRSRAPPGREASVRHRTAIPPSGARIRPEPPKRPSSTHAYSSSVRAHNGRWRQESLPVEHLPLDEEHRPGYDDGSAYSNLFGEPMMLAHTRAHGMMRGRAIRPAGVAPPEAVGRGPGAPDGAG
jgi:hypothetical protein